MLLNIVLQYLRLSKYFHACLLLAKKWETNANCSWKNLRDTSTGHNHCRVAQELPHVLQRADLHRRPQFLVLPQTFGTEEQGPVSSACARAGHICTLIHFSHRRAAEIKSTLTYADHMCEFYSTEQSESFSFSFKRL